MSLSGDEQRQCRAIARSLSWQVVPVVIGYAALLSLWTQGGSIAPTLMTLGFVVQSCVAIRLRLDARVFRQFADGTLTPADFDAALHALKLAGPPQSPGRPISDRIRGARRWIHRQWVLTVLCSALAIGARTGWFHD